MKKIDKRNIEDILPLTPMQEGMLYHYLQNTQGEIYFEQLSLVLSGTIYTRVFHEAWNKVVQANEMLRALFRWEKTDNPVQIILKKHEPNIVFIDLSGLDLEGLQRRLEEIKAEDRKNKFHLEDIPFRVTLCKIEEDKYEMIISNHHILYDGWSNGIILREFFEVYQTLFDGKPAIKRVKNKFKNYIKWIQDRDKQEQEIFWREYLKGFDSQTGLSIKRKRNGNGATGAAHYLFTIPGDLKEKLEDFVREHKVTLAAILYGTWGLVLQKLNNGEDVVFGTTVSGRSARVKGIEAMVGLFINTLPLRVQVSAGEKIADLLSGIDHTLRQRETFENTPLVEINGYSELDTHEGLFDSIVVIENYPLANGLMRREGVLSVDSYSMFEMTHYDLTVTIAIFDDMQVDFSYSKELFEQETVVRLSGYFTGVLEDILSGPNREISGVEIVTPEEKKKLLFEFNDTAVGFEKDKTIHQLFVEQVEKTTDAVALVGRSGIKRTHTSHMSHLTYKALNEKSNQLARVLISVGVRANDLVGLLPERTIEMLIGLLAILKVGAAYIPLGPEYPEDRIAYIMKECDAGILLTDEGRKWSTPSRNFQIINLWDKDNYKGEASNLTPQGGPTDPAYVIFTSGSTGNPKGVEIAHRSFINFVRGMTDIIPFRGEDRILSLTTLAFDIFGLETLLPLMKGSRVIVGRIEEQLNPRAAALALERECVTILQVTPSRLQLIISDEDASRKLSILKYLLVGGEAFPPALHQKIKELTGGNTGIYNVYGPTETTVWSTAKDVTGDEQLTIGKPIANTRIYILSRNNTLQPIGVPGELCIAGAGVARGYFKNPGLTGEKFVPDPFAAGETMYRTGDLAKWLPCGDIEFLGRLDFQVKIRGFRIELGEIENRLLRCEDVKDAVVMVRGDGENKYLCAYITTVVHEDPHSLIPRLKDYLAGVLPDYMIPAFFVFLEHIPLTAGGKINRKALPEPEKKSVIEYAAPGSREEALVEIWSAVLGMEKRQIGIDDNFFHLGGHSLKAVSMTARIHKKLQVFVPLAEMFKTPTIRGLSEYMKRELRLPTRNGAYTAIEPAPPTEYYPLSSAQKRNYVLSQVDKDNLAYNMIEAVIIHGLLDIARFEDTFRRLIRRHESFRTSFEIVDGEPKQKIHEHVEFHISLDPGEEKDFPRSITVEEIVKDFVRPFDLSRAPLFRVRLERVDEQKHILAVDMHHIISDGASVAILIRDFTAIYAGEELPPLLIQYKDFAWHQNSRKESLALKKQEEYWLKTFSGQPAVLDLPFDYERPQRQSYEGEVLTFELDSETTDTLKKLAAQEGATLFMIMLTIVYIWLWKLSHSKTIVVGSPIAGRRHADLEGIIGMFVNSLALKNSPSPEKSFKEFLKEVAHNTLEAYENQEYQFEDLVEKIMNVRLPGRHPVFDVMFALQNLDIPQIAVPGLTLDVYGYAHNVSPFDLWMTAEERGSGLAFKFGYSNKLFREESARNFVQYFREIVDAVKERQDILLKDIKISHRLLDPGIEIIGGLDEDFDF